MKTPLLSTLLVSALALGGCASFQTPPPPPAHPDLLTSTVPVSLRAIDQFASQLKELASPRDHVFVSPAQEISSLQGSSTLGRVLGDQLSGRLAQHGFKVTGPLVPASAAAAASAAKKSKQEYWVKASFAESSYEVLVTLQAMDASTGTVVTAHSFSLTTASVNKLLRPEVAKPTW